MKAESAETDSVDEADLQIVLWFDSFVFVLFIWTPVGRPTVMPCHHHHHHHTRMTLIGRKGSQSVRKPVSLSDSTRRPQLTALGILWNDVCERYARSKRSLGGELQVS